MPVAFIVLATNWFRFFDIHDIHTTLIAITSVKTRLTCRLSIPNFWYPTLIIINTACVDTRSIKSTPQMPQIITRETGRNVLRRRQNTMVRFLRHTYCASQHIAVASTSHLLRESNISLQRQLVTRWFLLNAISNRKCDFTYTIKYLFYFSQ